MNAHPFLKKKPLNPNHFIIKAPAMGSSMNPLIKEGCQLLIGLYPKQRYQNGDIVLFLKEGQLAAHRIIKIKDSNLLLKGDSNLKVDGYFKAQRLFGKVKKIIYPEYTINLDGRKNQFLKHFFVLYSHLNLRFPCLLKIREFYQIPLLKFFYRQLLKEASKKS